MPIATTTSTVGDASDAAPSAALRPAARSTRRRVIAVVSGLVLLLALSLVSLLVGSGGITAAESWHLLFSDDESVEALIVREYRVPRTLIAIVVGLALGLAGAIIQAITRNPLADPGILGVNAGAYTAVVFAAAWFGASVTGAHIAFSLVGALVSALVVYGIGTTGPSGGTPTKLVLTGLLSALCSRASASRSR